MSCPSALASARFNMVIAVVFASEAQQTQRMVLLLIVALVVVAVLLAGLTLWYWRHTDPRRRQQPRTYAAVPGGPGRVQQAAVAQGYGQSQPDHGQNSHSARPMVQPTHGGSWQGQQPYQQSDGRPDQSGW